MGFPAKPPAVDPRPTLHQYFQTMLRVFGPQKWWPARTRLEVILGAILTQNTSWRNVELALRNLRAAGLLKLDKLKRVPQAELEAYIRPAGFYRQKAGTIRTSLTWLDEKCQGSLSRMFARPADELRENLLALSGIGPETADAILLYAGNRPYFVADAYTRRVLSRHEMIPQVSSYESAQEFLHAHLERDARLYNEFHALLVETGKRFCLSASPCCDECPLKPFLPQPSAKGSHRVARTAPRNDPILRPMTGARHPAEGRVD